MSMLGVSLNCQNKLPQQAVKIYTKFKIESATLILLNYWCIIFPILKVLLKGRNRDILHKNN